MEVMFRYDDNLPFQGEGAVLLAFISQGVAIGLN
jgi:hypothetical protein